MTHDEEYCRKRIAQLEQENAELRRASAQFGQLAERLNDRLREERRTGTDRRHRTRSSSDRRHDPDDR
jgi:hypothetical protein